MPNVLLVDDNSKYLTDALPFYCYTVDTALDGVQALNILSKSVNKFDIVLLDVMMPNMNGWETLRNIRHNDKTKYLPVIMLTAVNDEQKVVTALKSGADDYVAKPFALPNLLARMEAVLRRSRWNTPKMQNLGFETADEKIPLTEREQEVLTMVARGASNKDIADKLFVKEVTVKTHLNNIFKKLKVTSRTQATLLAMQMDLIK